MISQAAANASQERREADAFLARLESHKRVLYRVAGGYCRNPQDREDLVQDIVVQLWRAYGRFDDRCKFSTWMYRIALNVAISFYRSETRRLMNAASTDDRVLEIAAVEPDAGAEDERLALLRRFIESLDEMHRALMILHLDGNRYDAIGEILGITQTNVATKLSRLKQRFRREFAHAEAD